MLLENWETFSSYKYNQLQEKQYCCYDKYTFSCCTIFFLLGFSHLGKFIIIKFITLNYTHKSKKKQKKLDFFHNISSIMFFFIFYYLLFDKKTYIRWTKNDNKQKLKNYDKFWEVKITWRARNHVQLPSVWIERWLFHQTCRCGERCRAWTMLCIRHQI